MAEIPSADTAGIEFIENDSNILLIAPHAVETTPYDDIGTAELTRRIAAYLECSAVINTSYRKPILGKPKRNYGTPSLIKRCLNLNLVKQAERAIGFIDKIKAVVDTEDLTHIFWIHGIADNNIEAIDGNAQCLIGYGQPDKDEDPHYTATQEIIQKLIEKLKDNEINVLEAPNNSEYRGWSPEYMNQWCNNNKYDFNQAQSIQLEFKYTGIRATESLDSAARSIGQAIKETTQEEAMAKKSNKDVEQADKTAPAQVETEIQDAEVLTSSEETKSDDTKSSEVAGENNVSKNLPAKVKKAVEDIAVSDDVIQEVYEHLKKIFVTNFQDAASKSMLESGEYLVKKFYGTYEKAQKKKFTRTESMSKLIKKIRDNASEGNIPSRTWVYDAVNLAIDNYLFKEKKLPSAYGQLGHSQKVNLTYAPDLAFKIKMIETLDKPTVAKIRESIAAEKAKLKKDTISFKETIVKDKLKKLRTTTLESYIKQIEEFETELEKQKKIYEANRQIIAEALEEAKKKALDKQQLNKTGKKKSSSKTTPKTSTPAPETTA